MHKFNIIHGTLDNNNIESSFPHLQRVLNKTLMLPYVGYIVLILVLLRHHLFRNISRHVSHEFKIFMYTQSTATTFEMVCLCQKSCYQIVATSCLMILKVQQLIKQKKDNLKSNPTNIFSK